MTKLTKVPRGGIDQMISNADSIQCQLDTATGAVVGVELRMRLFAEICQHIQDKIKELVNVEWLERKKKDPSAKKKSDDYSNCELCFLRDAICQVFCSRLQAEDLQKIEIVCKARNKLAHGDFIGLMKVLNIEPTRSTILSASGVRNPLKKGEIIDSVLSLIRNQGLRPVEILSREVLSILNCLMRLL